MKAVILAAGIASRLRPLTNNTPKCLLRIGSKSILELAIENLFKNNITDILIVTGYLGERIIKFVHDRFPGMNISFCNNDIYDSTNNIYSLWLAGKFLTGDDMLLMDSDIIFDDKIIAELLGSSHKNCLALKRHQVSDEEIKVTTDQKGRITEISKEVDPQKSAGESIGIELFRGELVNELFRVIDFKVNTENKVTQFYEAAFQELINNHHEIYIVDITDYFCMEIDTAEDLKIAGELYKLAQN
jgi:choline kinase